MERSPESSWLDDPGSQHAKIIGQRAIGEIAHTGPDDGQGIARKGVLKFAKRGAHAFDTE